jgi:predicted SnoaL-like aldol condensation-catalyzing enzyme
MMKNAKLMFATLAGISVLSVAFAKANEENVADAKMMAADTALAQKHFKAINETDLKKKKALFAEVYDPNGHFVSPRAIVDGRAELEKLFDEIHKQSPGVIFQDIGEIEAHHDIVRVHWATIDSGVSNGLAGDDFLKIKNGKVSEVYIIVNGWTKASAANGQEK